jgi:hypothetical protein
MRIEWEPWGTQRTAFIQGLNCPPFAEGVQFPREDATFSKIFEIYAVTKTVYHTQVKKCRPARSAVLALQLYLRRPMENESRPQSSIAEALPAQREDRVHRKA